MKRMGLDLGTRRIGIACSDETGRLAFPRETLERHGGRRDLERLGELVRREAPGELVLGLPLREDGSEGPEAERVRRFARSLREATGLPVRLEDERYSSREAAEALRERGIDGRRARGLVDAEAARILLQRYLDRGEAEAP